MSQKARHKLTGLRHSMHSPKHTVESVIEEVISAPIADTWYAHIQNDGTQGFNHPSDVTLSIGAYPATGLPNTLLVDNARRASMLFDLNTQLTSYTSSSTIKSASLRLTVADYNTEHTSNFPPQPVYVDRTFTVRQILYGGLTVLDDYSDMNWFQYTGASDWDNTDPGGGSNYGVDVTTAVVANADFVIRAESVPAEIPEPGEEIILDVTDIVKLASASHSGYCKIHFSVLNNADTAGDDRDKGELEICSSNASAQNTRPALTVEYTTHSQLL